MSTIKELSYLLLDMVNGGLPTDDSKINYRVAKAYVKNAVGYFLRRRYWEDKANSEDNYVGSTVTKKQEVKYDENLDQYYVEVLGESIEDTMKSYSISSQNVNSRWAVRFAPISEQELFNQSFLKARIPNLVQFYKRGGKLYFTNNVPEGLGLVVLSQSNVIPSNDDDSVPSDIASDAIDRAYRQVYAEIVINSDRFNDGVPQN